MPVTFADTAAPVSDATHATVNAIDPHTFVVDFGAATEGLNQSSLLQYLSPASTNLLLSTQQQLTFTAATATATAPVTGQFELQVGTVETAAIDFSSADPVTTAANMQAALVAAGFTGATVTNVTGTSQTVFTFDATFTSPEPAIQYLAVATTFPADLATTLMTSATFATQSAATTSRYQLLDFTATGNLPLTGTFELQVGAAGKATAPITFDSTSAATLQTTAANIQAALVADRSCQGRP